MASIQYGLITTITTDSGMKLHVSVNKECITITGTFRRKKAKLKLESWNELEEHIMDIIKESEKNERQ